MESHVTFVLDSSGSMRKIEEDTIGGFNTFLSDQQDEEGTASVSLYDFNTNVDTVYEGNPIEEAPQLNDTNYRPGGRTALYDAIATAIKGTDTYLASLDAEDRPENVIVVILTDGKENASETGQQQIREQVEYRREEFEWEFLFIGANQDAALTAENVGIDRDKSLDMDHSGEGTQAAYESVSSNISQARQEGSAGEFDEADRQRQRDAGQSDNS